MLGIFIIAAIAIAIFLGAKTKINTGLFCMVFAYIIGCFVMGLKPKEIIGFWPTSTMFVILSVSLFYNIAAVNGTLEKMSGSLLYTCRKFPGLLPYALLAVAIILSVMGATYFTVLAFLAPITLLICEESRMDKLTGAIAINCGALAGGNFPTSNLGVVFRGLADTAYENIKNRPLYDEGEYVVFKPIELLEEGEVPDSVVFTLNTMELSAVLQLNGSFRTESAHIMTPQASACQAIGAFTFEQNDSDDPVPVLSPLDFAARAHMRRLVPDEYMNLSMPWKLFLKLEELSKKSVFQTHFWDDFGNK